MPATPSLPLLSDATLPALPLLARWLEVQRRAGTTALSLPQLPASNGSLPDVLAACRITKVQLAEPSYPQAFRWEGCGGGRVTVNAHGSADDSTDDSTDDSAVDELPLHHGHLPTSGATGDGEPGLEALLDLARLEDASALRALSGTGAANSADLPIHGAAWDHILAAAGAGTAPRIPPLAGRITANGAYLGAWNPLPFARHLTVSLPLPRGTAPWGVTDGHGARHPVQVVEGPLGRELLTTLRLGAMEAVTFTPLFDPIPGTHWEVSRTVLDNGRVRVELDPFGQIVRLCCDGRFVDWAGPAVQPLVDGLPLGGTSSTSVLEEGPVRARVVVSRTTAQGNLHLTYTLHAHEAVLRIAASWDGEAELVLDHPTTLRAALLQLAGDMAAWKLPQQASVIATPMPIHAGVRWAVLAGADGKGLAVTAARPLALSAHAGHLRIYPGRATAYALHEATDCGSVTNLAHLGAALGTPGRAYDGGRNLPAAWRFSDVRLTCCWARKPEGWNGELLMVEPRGFDGKTTLFLTANEAWRCAIDGAPLSALTRTPESDGFEIIYDAGAIFAIRWR